jgi:hypothetical protein
MLLVGLVALRLWLGAGQTLRACSDCTHDDDLFASLAASFSLGRWLGPYSELTLVKGPFYPIFVGLNAWLGLPLSASQDLAHAAACWLVVAALLRPLRLGGTAVASIFAVLLFDPVMFTSEMLSVRREAIYVPLTLSVFGCCAALLLRAERPARALLGWSAGLGASFAAFWLTREEGVWILPLLGFTLGPLLWHVWRGSRPAWPRLAALGIAPLVFAGSVGAVAALNHRHYGTWSVIELRQRDFLDAYGAVTRVEPNEALFRVPAPRETWPRLAGASSAFAELLPHLVEIAPRWADERGELIAFFWPFREAAALAGRHRSAGSARAFYRRLAAEVNGACERRELRCGPRRSSLFPGWGAVEVGPLVRAVLEATRQLVTLGGFDPKPLLSLSSSVGLSRFEDITRDRLSPRSRGQWRISGWVFDASGPVRLTVRHADGSLAQAELETLPSADVYRRFAAAGRGHRNQEEARFSLVTPCLEGCWLQADVGGRAPVRFALESLQGCGGQATLHWCIEHQTLEESPGPLQSRVDEARIAILRWLGRAYQVAVPFLAVAAGVLLASGLWRSTCGRGARLDLLWLEAALLGAIATRVLILALIDVTAFAGIHLFYLAPAHVLLLVAIAIPLLRVAREPQGECVGGSG